MLTCACHYVNHMPYCRILKIAHVSIDYLCCIGICSPDAQQDYLGLTYQDPSSHCVYQSGVYIGGQYDMKMQNEVLDKAMHGSRALKRPGRDLFREGDEVKVTVDCTLKTMRFQSPTLDHTLPLKRDSKPRQWVLMVTSLGPLDGGSCEIRFVGYG